MIGFRNGKRGKGGGGWLLDSQVIRIFCLKNHLIILRVVMYVIRVRMCFRAVMSQLGNFWLAIFLKTVVG